MNSGAPEGSAVHAPLVVSAVLLLLLFWFYRLFDEVITRKVINIVQEESEDTKGVIRSRKSNDRQHNDQKEKNKQRSTKHYTDAWCRYFMIWLIILKQAKWKEQTF